MGTALAVFERTWWCVDWLRTVTVYTSTQEVAIDKTMESFPTHLFSGRPADRQGQHYKQ